MSDFNGSEKYSNDIKIHKGNCEPSIWKKIVEKQSDSNFDLIILLVVFLGALLFLAFSFPTHCLHLRLLHYRPVLGRIFRGGSFHFHYGGGNGYNLK